MTTVALDHLGLLFAGGCLVVWMGIVLILARVMGMNERLSQNQREELAERRETDGPFADLTAEREKRIARAQFRHTTRWSRDAS